MKIIDQNRQISPQIIYIKFAKYFIYLMISKLLLPQALLLLGSSTTNALHLGSEAQSQVFLQARLQELVEDEQLIDLSVFNQEEQYSGLLEGDGECRETGWKNYLQIGQQVHQMSFEKEASKANLESVRLMRESELKQNAKRAEKILEQRLAQAQSLAETDKKTVNQEEFKQQMHDQIKQLNNILDGIEVEAQTVEAKTKQHKFIQQQTRVEDKVTLEVKAKRVLHIVPHSHTDDLSSNKDLQKQLSESTPESELYTKGSPAGFMGSVDDILNSTMLELYADGNKTFTFGDLKYFKKWYDKLSPTDKADVKVVVQNGQLDLVNGGWMPVDEALTQYDSLLDSFQVGQQFLWKEFEYQPRVSWQLDVNGVSQGYARLAKDVGLDMLIFSSVSQDEKKKMREKGTHTQIWRTSSKNFGKRKDVLAVTLDQGESALNSYCWPKGFWADTNYLIDSPMNLNNKSEDYHFDDLVKSLYADISDRFDQDKSTQLFQPFGCDMAYVDAKLNYKIMDKLMQVWKELGFNKDVEIKYSTPTIFYQNVQKQNNKFIAAAQVSANSTQNVTLKATEKDGWTVRKDDTFPYQPAPQTFLNGYYSSRPHLKKKVREFTQSFHSSLRLLSQQVLRKDLDDKQTTDVLQFQTGILESIGNLQSYEAITGTSNQFLSGEYYSNAQTGKDKVMEMNSKFLAEKLEHEYGIKVNKLDSDMQFNFKEDDLTSTYSHDNKTLVVVQNPSQQKREQIVEIQVPYYNFTVEQVLNNSKRMTVQVDKYLPRVWQNSQKFVVPSLAQFKVVFNNPNELYKVFIITGQGVIRKKNPVPDNYPYSYEREPRIWNLNLPVFLPKNGWEINNFQQNFLTLLPNATITAGSKSLQFLEIVPKKVVQQQSTKKSKNSKGLAASEQAPAQNTSESESVVKDTSSESGSKKGYKEPIAVDSSNSTGPVDPIADEQQDIKAIQDNGTNSTNDTQSLASSKQKRRSKTKVRSLADENEGAAVFLYTDKVTGVSQKFAFSLRYYVGENAVGEPLQKSNSTGLMQLDRKIESGVYSFAVNGGATPGTSASQKSYRYGEVNLKRSKKKVNNDSAEFLLVYEQGYGEQVNSTGQSQPKSSKKIQDKFKNEQYSQKIRAHVRINLNTIDDFVQFHVSTNEVPISQDKTGKDVVVDWFLLDGFDTNEQFWVDSNGLQMVPKTLNSRSEYELKTKRSVSANYYPITSAIAVRDFNQSMVSGNSQRQVTILTDRSQGASAGMRSRKNIEIMHQRRYRKSNSSKSAGDGLNDLDGNGRGLQVKETYYMQVSRVGQSNQRSLQKKIDQPLLISYAQGYQIPSSFDSSKSTQAPIDIRLMEKISRQISGSEESQKKQQGLIEQAKLVSQGYAMKKKGDSENEFKGRDKDHQDNSIPDKTVSHYPPDMQSKTADQNNQPEQSKPKPKPKKKEKVPEPASYDDPAGVEPPTFAQKQSYSLDNIDAQINSIDLVSLRDQDTPDDKDKPKKNSTTQVVQEVYQLSDLDEKTYNKKAKQWYNKYNKDFKESSTMKLLVFGVQKNQIMIRVANLEDNFDGFTAQTHKFDINAWAREFYLEANSHLLAKNTSKELLQGIRLNITEMNLAGSVAKSYFKNKTQAQPKWFQQGSFVETSDSFVQTFSESEQALLANIEKEPLDNVQFVELERAKGSVEGLGMLFEPNYIVNVEPQSIRTFSIQYFMPNLNA